MLILFRRIWFVRLFIFTLYNNVANQRLFMIVTRPFNNTHKNQAYETCGTYDLF